MSDLAVRDTRSPAQILTAQVRSDEFKEQVGMALPENMPPSRFVRSTVTALMQNQDLAKCEPDSLFASLIKCAQDGLLPDGREAAIVPFGKAATYMVMIGGLRKVVAEYGWQVRTAVVYEADEFNYELGLNIGLSHKPAPVTADRGKPIAAYAIAAGREGRRELEVMTVDEIEKVRNVSRAKNSGPWKDWWDRMAEKTVARRLIPKLALDPGDKRVAGLMVDAQEIGPERSQELLYGPGGSTFAAREIEQGEDSQQGAADGGPEASADPAGGSGGSSTGDEPTTDGAPAAVPGAEPPAPPASGFQIPEQVLDAAAAHVVVHTDPKSGWNGRTLASIAEDQEYGAKWLAWAAGPDGDLFLDEATVSAVRLLVEHRHPDIWAQVIGGAA